MWIGRFAQIIVDAMLKHARLLDHLLDRSPLFNWAQFRWFEALIALFDLYEITGEEWHGGWRDLVRSVGGREAVERGEGRRPASTSEQERDDAS